MRREVFRLWHLLQRRKQLEESATSVGSPGYEPHYGSNRPTTGGFEDKIIAACDLDEEIDEAVNAVVHSVEADYLSTMTETSGLRRRVLMLKYICGMSNVEIADLLDVSTKTVKRRLESGDSGDEVKLLPIDAYIEDYIAGLYCQVQNAVDYRYPEVERLISAHKSNAVRDRRRYEAWTESLDGKTKDIANLRLQGRQWNDIAEKVGLSERQVRRIYKDSIAFITNDFDT